MGERGIQTSLVGHQDWPVTPAAFLTEQTEQLRGVGELRDPFRWHEGCRLDHVEPGGHQTPDELGLDLHRDQALLVLESVARSDLVDGDPPGHVGEGFTLRSSHGYLLLEVPIVSGSVASSPLLKTQTQRTVDTLASTVHR